MIWLDITRKCQLACVHCYNSSGPQGTKGSMRREDWLRIVRQVADEGIPNIQFIGGEPTLHPDFPEFLTTALGRGLELEVFSNLVRVSEEIWALLRHPRASLATSYYSVAARTHDAVTGRSSHARTRRNIVRAVELSVPIRVGIVGDDAEEIRSARRELEGLGVTRLGVDHVRRFGRAVGTEPPQMSQLCGRCGSGAAAVGPDGAVSPCVFSTEWQVGNVRDQDLSAVLAGPAMRRANKAIRHAVSGSRDTAGTCYPKQHPCFPAGQPCEPRGDVPPACNPEDFECAPGTPSTGCNPHR
ncbi:radical SAM protein [Streptomyces bohaiensis]|uniref:Radical SAM protein n=1 Tax=Streptomyces bohaiensis TaxID=1431344 RepID=A0ABX1CBF2_9ACTN|nr:radical SAM protein [Streptomyces bohaiensis]NJQ14557.1 radical SAM protein [Streptomyces bohaiensis]